MNSYNESISSNSNVVNNVSNNSGKNKYAGRDTLDSLVNKCVDGFLDFYDSQPKGMSPSEIQRRLMTQLDDDITEHNEVCARQKFTRPHHLPTDVVAKVINHCRCVKNISLTGDKNPDTTILGVYAEDGEYAGTYITDENYIKNMIMEYSRFNQHREINDVVSYLKSMANTVNVNREPHLSIVNNGIYNRETGELEPFRPEYVALSKISTDYNKDATNPKITMPDGKVWDCEWQLDSMTDDPEIRKLLRDMLTCAAYPYQKWDKFFMPYSTIGNNGKGTYCALIRGMLGYSGCVSVSLKDFGNDFTCAKLIGSSRVICDENDVATYVPCAANLKSAVTQDPINLNRKYKDPITLVWMGFMLQCLNDFPRFRDRSDSMLRRMVIIPFDKSFKGCERKYIREDYLKRKDVREYYLKIALESDITEIEVPDRCNIALDDYKENNDPVYEFYNSEVRQYGAWTFYPLVFVWEHYKAWYKLNIPSGKVGSFTDFKQQIVTFAEQDPERFAEANAGRKDDNPKTVPAKAMDGVEPNILRYNLEAFMNKSYHGTDEKKITNFKRSKTYRGYLIRNTGAAKENDDKQAA